MERRVLTLAEEMTKTVHVEKQLVDDLSGDFDHKELVELVATIAAYNMVSRFIEAFGIHIDDQR